MVTTSLIALHAAASADETNPHAAAGLAQVDQQLGCPQHLTSADPATFRPSELSSEMPATKKQTWVPHRTAEDQLADFDLSYANKPCREHMFICMAVVGFVAAAAAMGLTIDGGQ